MKPSLILDLGGTLIGRKARGPCESALELIADTGQDITRARPVTKQIMLTGRSLEDACAALAEQFPAISCSAFQEAVTVSARDARILPGALDLLKTAHDSGWQMIFITNSAAWAVSIPRELTRYSMCLIASSSVRVTKSNPQFWQHVERVVPERARSLVVGDDFMEDIAPARDAGYLAYHVGTDQPLAGLEARIREAGHPPSERAFLSGWPKDKFAERDIVPCPHLASLVRDVTRARFNASVDGQTVKCELVRRRMQPPALYRIDGGPPPQLTWLTAAVRATYRVPHDLSESLGSAGVTLDHLSTQDRRHLISLVRESRDPLVRRMRIADVVQHVKSNESRWDEETGELE